jgi:hypothetical protein
MVSRKESVLEFANAPLKRHTSHNAVIEGWIRPDCGKLILKEKELSNTG